MKENLLGSFKTAYALLLMEQKCDLIDRCRSAGKNVRVVEDFYVESIAYPENSRTHLICSWLRDRH